MDREGPEHQEVVGRPLPGSSIHVVSMVLLAGSQEASTGQLQGWLQGVASRAIEFPLFIPYLGQQTDVTRHTQYLSTQATFIQVELRQGRNHHIVWSFKPLSRQTNKQTNKTHQFSLQEDKRQFILEPNISNPNTMFLLLVPPSFFLNWLTV